MSKPNAYRVKFGTKRGVFCGLNFRDGISKETVAGPMDRRYRWLRNTFGSSKCELIPADTGEATAAPAEASIPDTDPIEGAESPAAASAEQSSVPSSPPEPAYAITDKGKAFVEKMRAARAEKPKAKK
jgi:hypothetical protein